LRLAPDLLLALISLGTDCDAGVLLVIEFIYTSIEDISTSGTRIFANREKEAVTSDREQREALAEFLKTRRSQVSPESVGLARGAGYRRTSGLRREEVALLAGISVTWYTWLEQGRDIVVSEQVLKSLATVFKLSSDETSYMFRLANKPEPQISPPPQHAVPAAVRMVLDDLKTSPAYVMDYHWNLLAWNRAACEIFAIDTFSPQDRNLLWRTFTNKEIRRRLINWEEVAWRTLAAFRATLGDHIGEPWFTQLVEDLKQTSPEFRNWWPSHDVRQPPLGRIALEHPEAGLLELDSISTHIDGDPRLWMCIYAPEKDTADKIKQLIESVVASD
jgi:transcriptional regulator with XRE-family HTH domain